MKGWFIRRSITRSFVTSSESVVVINFLYCLARGLNLRQKKRRPKPLGPSGSQPSPGTLYCKNTTKRGACGAGKASVSMTFLLSGPRPMICPEVVDRDQIVLRLKAQPKVTGWNRHQTKKGPRSSDLSGSPPAVGCLSCKKRTRKTVCVDKELVLRLHVFFPGRNP